ncbi:MAG: VirB8/TrbF family protein [Pyrinomonadaceae bacterium]
MMIDQFIGRRLADKYEIESIIRENDFGGLYKGRHLLMEKPVSVKVLSPALAVDEHIVERFSENARIVSRLSHPNILNVTDFGRDYDGTVFVVMEDAEGETLRDALLREGAFTVERAVRITRQIAAALSAAHANGIVHGKLSPDSILLTELGNGSKLVKITDLGTFDEVVQTDFDEETPVENIGYLSPEQCANEGDYDERSDVYTLGIMLYEMLIGVVPFDGETTTEVMLKHAEVPPPPLAAYRDDVPPEVETVAIRAVAKNPDMRYQTVAAFAEDLSEAAKLESDTSAVIVPSKAVAAKAGNNNVWKTAFISLVALSLLAFGLIYWTKTKQTEPVTVQQVDKDGKPVQPLSPATGIAEKNLPDMNAFTSGSMNPEDMMVRPDGTVVSAPAGGGGDGFDPWANPGAPPSSGGSYAPGGENVTIPGNSGSIFTQDEPFSYDEKGNPIYLVPVPSNSPKADKTAKPDDVKATDAKQKPVTDKPADKKTDTKPKTEKPAEKKADTVKPASEKPKGSVAPTGAQTTNVNANQQNSGAGS